MHIMSHISHGSKSCFFSLQDCLRSCQEQIERELAKNFTNPQSSSEAQYNNYPATSPKTAETGQPTTPTDVRDISLM